MSKLANLAKMNVASAPGAGAFDLDAAVSGFLTFAGAGITDGDVVSYGAREGANSEVGTGVYTASGTTLSRTVLDSTNGGAEVVFGAGVEVFITPNAADLAQLDQAQTFTAAQTFDAGVIQPWSPIATTTGTHSIVLSDGDLQKVTLTGPLTFTDGLADNEGVVLAITGAGNLTTWTAVDTWVNNGGSGPATDTATLVVVAIWKDAGTVYGSLVGDGS